MGSPRPTAGRKPKPTAEHVREGTFRRDRHGPEEGVRPADGRQPRMPAGFSPAMKVAWKTLLDDLDSSALLDSADAPLYEAFAVAHGRAREARALIRVHGLLVDGARVGQLVANPMIRVEREALAQVRMLAVELAMGMRARASLGMAVARGAVRGKPGDNPAESPAPTSGKIGLSPRLPAVPGGRT